MRPSAAIGLKYFSPLMFLSRTVLFERRTRDETEISINGQQGAVLSAERRRLARAEPWPSMKIISSELLRLFLPVHAEYLRFENGQAKGRDESLREHRLRGKIGIGTRNLEKIPSSFLARRELPGRLSIIALI